MATVRYLVRDVDQSVAFYGKHLGFTVQQQFGPNMAIVTRDGLTLWLAGPGASAARPMPDGRKPEPGGWNRIQLEVSDLEREVEALRAAGASFRGELVTGRGGSQILVDDPSGNPVELFQPAV
jgi:catechol 2,3-dioxygenase-like lactoylglutathione lyase family enzyme